MLFVKYRILWYKEYKVGGEDAIYNTYQVSSILCSMFIYQFDMGRMERMRGSTKISRGQGFSYSLIYLTIERCNCDEKMKGDS